MIENTGDSKPTENNENGNEDNKQEVGVKEDDVTNLPEQDKVASPVRKFKSVSNQLSPSSYK